MIQKTDKMPIWVSLLFSSVKTRKGALWLIGANVAFSIYCIPWSRLFSEHDWIVKIFLINDWTWFAMMVPITFWYWISLRWIDNNYKWADSVQQKE
jgi:hypothetical protein